MITATQRTDRINKLYKVAKKYFQPVEPRSNRTVMEHLLYGCCLENSPFELADEVFAQLQEEYFDWNEVRVTTTNELAEVMKRLPDPADAAQRVRKTLHGLFEAHYSFDLEFLRKANLGKAIEQIEKYRGVSPFCLAYVTQAVLGGHSIPIDDALLKLMQVIGVISEDEAQSSKVTGLERTIPKNKGLEFFSLVHQLAVQFRSNPFGKEVRDLILEIEPTAQDRFPKRVVKKKEAETPEPAAKKSTTPAPVSPAAAVADKGSDKAAGKSKSDKPAAATKPTAEASGKTATAAPKTAPVKPEPKKSAAPATAKAPAKPAGKGTAEGAKPPAKKGAPVSKTPPKKVAAPTPPAKSSKPTPAKKSAPPARNAKPDKGKSADKKSKDKGDSKKAAKRKPR